MPGPGGRTGGTFPCPRCGTPVLRQHGTGRVLEATPHELALHLPGGGQLDATQAIAVLTGRCPPRGHHTHAPGPYGCNPQAAQATLF